jgi:RNA 2',3'-cyclic 3'-phosphodiesterase
MMSVATGMIFQQIGKNVESDNPSAFLRLFIAIPVPLDVREEIGRAQGQLRRHSPPGAIRWTRPEQFHVTLKFLGDVPTAQVAALESLVSRACAGFPALQLSAHGIGFFPNEQRPRVIWAGADDHDGQLAELHRRIEPAVRPFALSAKPERFASHITLGRFKPGHHGTMEKLLKRATILRHRHFGDWPAVEVEIVRSKPTAPGAVHTPLGSYRLV